MNIEHRTVSGVGVQLHVAVAGEGPLVVLLHGFPELWSAWHHQIPALAAAGFRVAAPDLRGYGQSEGPEDSRAYTIVHCVGDVMRVIESLDERTAFVVGHDWGGPIAWNCALLRPDVVRGVVALNSPYRARSPAPPMQTLHALGLHAHYFFYMQRKAAADAFGLDVAYTMRTLLFGASADAPAPDESTVLVPEGRGFLDSFATAPAVPSWVHPEHFARLVSEYERTGFQKPLYLYHNLDSNWELLAAWSGKRIEQPALLLAGDRDPTLVSAIGKLAVEDLPNVVPNVAIRWIDHAGHWLQQEKPAEVTSALLEFLRKHT